MDIAFILKIIVKKFLNVLILNAIEMEVLHLLVFVMLVKKDII
jgi:hypothetical protein